MSQRPRTGIPVVDRIRRAAEGPLDAVDSVGDQFSFYGRTLGSIPLSAKRYRGEIRRHLASVAFGSGGLALVGGTALIVAFLSAAAGFTVILVGYNQLANVGVDALTGFVSAFVNTRLVAPIIAGIALVATVGAGFTAEIGAMRISEELDALEVMAVPPIPYMITTRIIAAMIAVTPLYAVALFASYGLARLGTILFYGQSVGTYDHYFSTFLIPSDILSSFLEVLAMSVLVTLIHCYYGFHAGGGPAGVGLAVGRAVRLSFVVVMLVALLLSLVLYGHSDSLRISR
jgi:phospholipid/cholesterol/gamma-HCH transport system permease protein